MAVGRGKALVGHDVGVGVAIPLGRLGRGQIVVRHVNQPRHLGVEQRHIYELPPPCAGAMVQSGQNRLAGKQARRHIGNGHPHFARLPIGFACNGHDAPLCLNHKIVAGQIFIWPCVAVARDGAIDEVGIAGSQRFVIQSHFSHRAHLEVFDENIGRGQ